MSLEKVWEAGPPLPAGAVGAAAPPLPTLLFAISDIWLWPWMCIRSDSVSL